MSWSFSLKGGFLMGYFVAGFFATLTLLVVVDTVL